MEQPDGKAHPLTSEWRRLQGKGRGKNGRQAPEPPLQLATRVEGDEAENGDRAGRTTQRSSPLGIQSRRHRQHPRRRSFRGKQGRPRVWWTRATALKVTEAIAHYGKGQGDQVARPPRLLHWGEPTGRKDNRETHPTTVAKSRMWLKTEARGPPASLPCSPGIRC